MRVIGYVRLFRASREESTSVERQRLLITQTAESRGWDLVEIVEDVDVSATRTRLDRPGLNRARALIRRGIAEALLTWRLDRVARSVADIGVLLDEGLHLVSATEPFDTTSPMGRAMVEVSQVVAGLEAKTTGLRVAASQEHLRKVGRWPGGVLTYGYRKVPHPTLAGWALEPDPVEAAVVRRAAEAVLGGASVYSVAQALNAEGIPPRRPVRKLEGGETARREWSASSLQRLLRSDAVLGRVREGGDTHRKVNGRKGTTKARPIVDASGEPVVFWEPILTVAQVERLRAATEWKPTPGRREATRGRATIAQRALAGVVVCGTCGRALAAKARNTTGRPVYSCAAQARGNSCERPVTAEAERIEAEAERQVLAVIGRFEVMREEISSPHERLAAVEEAIRRAQADLGVPGADFAEVASRAAALAVPVMRLVAF